MDWYSIAVFGYVAFGLTVMISVQILTRDPKKWSKPKDDATRPGTDVKQGE